MLQPALDDPDPVIIFEHAGLYNDKGDLPSDPGVVAIEGAVARREGRDVTLVAYGGTLRVALGAAEELAAAGVSAEVVDLRCLRPLDSATVASSVTKTHRVVVLDEGWRTGSLSAEVASRIGEDCFYDLDAPVARVCTAEVPIPYAKHLEDAALPQAADVVAAVHKLGG